MADKPNSSQVAEEVEIIEDTTPPSPIKIPAEDKGLPLGQMNIPSDDEDIQETPPAPKRNISFPETPRKPRGFSKLVRKCMCHPALTEHEWNKGFAHVFDSQFKHFEFHEDKYRIRSADILMQAEFKIGINFEVKVILLRADHLVASKRVLLSIEDGINNIVMYARDFLKYDFTLVCDTLVDHSSDNGADLNFPESMGVDGPTPLELSYASNSAGDCVVFSSTWDGFPADKIHISSYTWVEFKNIHHILSAVTEYYQNLCLQGRAYQAVPWKRSLPNFSDEETDSDCEIPKKKVVYKTCDCNKENEPNNF
jgi:hypothetical protein